MRSNVLFRILVAAVILAVFASLVFISQVLFRNYPTTMDEYHYLYQAQIFNTGHLSLQANPELKDLFEESMIFKDGKLFSKYPPGFSFFLFWAIKLGIPGFLNPLFSALSLLLIFLLCSRLLGNLFSLVTIAVIGTNAYFLAYGASYFSQPATLFFLSFALLFYERYQTTQKIRFLAATALLIALQTTVRPLDAFCLGIVLFCDLCRKENAPRTMRLLVFFGLASIGLLLLMGYWKITMGAWCIAPFSVWDTDFKLFYAEAENSPGSFFLNNSLSFIKANILRLKTIFWPLLIENTLPYIAVWIPVIVLGFFSKKDPARDEFIRFRTILLSYSLLIIVLYHMHPATGYPIYGTRYWYPFLIIVLAVLFADGLRELCTRNSRPFFWALISLCIVWQLGDTFIRLARDSKRVQIMQNLETDIREKCPPGSIVILHGPKKEWPRVCPPYTQWRDLKRNPFLSPEHFYLLEGCNAQTIQRFYPHHSVCDYEIDHL